MRTYALADGEIQTLSEIVAVDSVRHAFGLICCWTEIRTDEVHHRTFAGIAAADAVETADRPTP